MIEREPEVRLPYPTLFSLSRPDIPLLWKNDDYINWAISIGCQSVELHCTKGVVREVLGSLENIKNLDKIRSGHVIYNPYATFWKVISKENDPLRPKEKFAFYNLAMAENKRAIKALKRIETSKQGDFPIVTYNYSVDGQKPYGEFQKPLIQTHPAVFNDKSTAADLVNLVKSGQSEGIVWDTYHAFEATSSGNRPLADWQRSLDFLINNHALWEVHVQAGRIYNNEPDIPSFDWLRGMVGENPRYNDELGKIISLAKQTDEAIPFVVEIGVDSLVKAGLIKRSAVFFDPDKVKSIQREIVDFIKKV